MFGGHHFAARGLRSEPEAASRCPPENHAKATGALFLARFAHPTRAAGRLAELATCLGRDAAREGRA